MSTTVHIHVFTTEAELAQAAAKRIVDRVRADASAVVGLATGSSPVAVYAEWGRQARELGLDQSGVRGFALDEYLGLDPSDPRSYHAVIRRDAVAGAGLNAELVRIPDGSGRPDAAEEYERTIMEAGGVDVQVLGLGRNGHLGFNEPGSSATSRTRVVSLAETTISDNARFFERQEDVPTAAITQGLGTIFEARELLVIAVGPAKAAAVQAAIEGEVTEALPASLLQTHQNVHWFLDEAAAAGLAAVG
ncbi:glucosamine-6-phosphate deaminase [Leucobacter sp. NPDC015123]|uniref:glucosamine-6-phosphate deaminase n=1 Tax=Leucobacter sp. NPDC015123 TaxID=3364129 RepID=UPI0036F49D0C